MKPLEGIRVVELATFVAAPSCGRILAYMGAEVIKVETKTGDTYRKYTAYTKGDTVVFDALNGQKKSISMDLKDPEAIECFKQLLSTADIFISNLRESALERLGLGCEAVKKLKKDIIYAHFSGYGPKGPMASSPGFDSTAFAVRSGLYRDFVPPNSEPNTHITGFGDMISGMAMAMNILASLNKRNNTGEGDKIECSLNETAAWVLMMPMVYEQYTSRYCREEGKPVDIANSSVKCGDGEWIYFGCGTIKQWNDLCSAIGCSHLKDDIRCKTLNDIIWNTDELAPIIRPLFMKKSAEEWIEILRKHDVPCERHRHIREMASDEQLIANRFIEPVQYGEKTVMMPNPPVSMQSCELFTDEKGPTFGGDTDALLLNLGCSGEQIASLREKGAIH